MRRWMPTRCEGGTALGGVALDGVRTFDLTTEGEGSESWRGLRQGKWGLCQGGNAAFVWL